MKRKNKLNKQKNLLAYIICYFVHAFVNALSQELSNALLLDLIRDIIGRASQQRLYVLSVSRFRRFAEGRELLLCGAGAPPTDADHRQLSLRLLTLLLSFLCRFLCAGTFSSWLARRGIFQRQ